MYKRILISSLLTLTLIVGGLFTSNLVSYADGNGSPTECSSNPNENPNAGNVLGSRSGSDDQVVVDAGAGNIVSGVCIKSGEGTFGGATHSGVLGNGIHDNGCYQVLGVGTQTVTVTRLQNNNVCKGISHIDVIFTSSTPPPVKPGGMGGGSTEPTLGTDSSKPAPTNTPQVKTTPPQGQGVSAGGGGGAGPATASLVGLTASLLTFGYGILRFYKA